MAMMVASTRFGVNDVDAQALIARMTTPPSGARAKQIETLIRELKVAGVWAKLACLYLLAAHDVQAARLNWVANANNPTVSGTPTFTTDRGYTGDAASSARLDTGYMIPAGNQNSAHLMAWLRTSAAAADFAAIGNGNAVLSVRRSSDGNSFCRVNAPTAASIATADASGCWVGSRTGSLSSDFTVYRNGVSVGSGGASSETPDATYPIWILGRNGPTPSFTYREIAAASIGTGLSAGDVTAFHAALNTYLVAVGAA